MMRQLRFGGPVIAPFVVAVAVLILVGHVCVASLTAHEVLAAPGHADEASHDAGLHHWSSCEAVGSTLSTANAPDGPSAITVASCLTAPAADTAIAVAGSPALRSRADRPALFVLHASLLI